MRVYILAQACLIHSTVRAEHLVLIAKNLYAGNILNIYNSITGPKHLFT